MRNSDKKILLLGASGRLGTCFRRQMRDYTILGTYASRPFAGGAYFDILKDSIELVIKDLDQFSHAIVLIGETDTDRCALDLNYSEKVNVVCMKRLIERLIAKKIHITFASSEWLFSGTHGYWKETDTPHPKLAYGKQKYQIEKFIRQKTDQYLIVRLAKTYGTKPGDGTLFTTWIDKLLLGQPIIVTTDQVFSPIWVSDLVDSVVRLVELGATGVYHIGGPKAYLRKDLFDMTVGKLRRKKDIHPAVTYTSIDDLPLAEKRPHDVSLSIEKLVVTTGFRPKDPDSVSSIIMKRYSL